jgi:hypothetical protein
MKIRKIMLGLAVTAASVGAVVAPMAASGASLHKTPQQLRQPATLIPFPITHIVASDAVSFDIQATGLAPGRQAEVHGGLIPSFVFNSLNGWTQVTRTGVGHYCLNTNRAPFFNYVANVSVANRPGLTSVPGGLVQYDSFGAGCPGVAVSTYQIVP